MLGTIPTWSFLSHTIPSLTGERGHLAMPNDWCKRMFERGLEQMTASNFEAAVEYFSKVIKLEPESLEAYEKRGIAYGHLDEYEKAAHDFSKILKRQPDNMEVIILRAETNFKLARYEVSIQDWNNALELSPDRHGCRLFRSIAYQRAGDLAKAMDDINICIESKYDPANSYYQRGSVWLDMGEDQRGVRDLRKSIQLDANNPDPHFTLACHLKKSGKPNKAIEELSIYLDLGPDDPEAHFQLARCYGELNNLNKAIDEYSKCIELDPASEYYYRSRAEAYWLQHNAKQALIDYTSAINYGANDSEIFWHRGEAKESLKLYKDCLTDYKTAADLNALRYGKSYEEKLAAISSNGEDDQSFPEELSQYDASPGWDALSSAWRHIFGENDPDDCFATTRRYAAGGPDPLDQISIYREDGPPEHLHYATYGFSELDEKKSENPDLSGYGFELTMRVRCDAEEDVPFWPAVVLQDIARHVFRTGNPLKIGDNMDFKGPLTKEVPTNLTGVIFVKDEAVDKISTPNGLVNIIQVVGVTADEFEIIKLWKGTEFVKRVLAERNPFLVTNIKRKSVAPLLDLDQIKKDGSSVGLVFVDELAWKEQGSEGVPRVQLTISRSDLNFMEKILVNRIQHDRDLILQGASQSVILRPDSQTGWTPESKDHLEIRLSKKLASKIISSFKKLSSYYEWDELPGLTVQVPSA